ncbi:unnamed protein product [Thlaspi arvense]|uniref:CCT domain-containing protein n=1 Tax=Thlaspi arvense TaxID=13288 RepID=A0AAU9RT56_THLAR|nr:unnamed protein product [Thlaspi arvense]
MRVQAVLLLLGGQEVPPTMPMIPISNNQNAKGLSSTPQRFSVPQRLASLIRFREKRKERNFDKKIRYAVRKEVALRMQRNKGQFTSSKPNSDDPVSASITWDSTQSWALDGSGTQQQEIVLCFLELVFAENIHLERVSRSPDCICPSPTSAGRRSGHLDWVLPSSIVLHSQAQRGEEAVWIWFGRSSAWFAPTAGIARLGRAQQSVIFVAADQQIFSSSFMAWIAWIASRPEPKSDPLCGPNSSLPRTPSILWIASRFAWVGQMGRPRPACQREVGADGRSL